MSRKSEIVSISDNLLTNIIYVCIVQVPLGIIPKNENKSDKMVDIMTSLHKYVPIVEYTEELYIASIDDTVHVPQALLHPIILGGDQLTAARGREGKEGKSACRYPSKPSRKLSSSCRRLAYQSQPTGSKCYWGWVMC